VVRTLLTPLVESLCLVQSRPCRRNLPSRPFDFRGQGASADLGKSVLGVRKGGGGFQTLREEIAVFEPRQNLSRADRVSLANWQFTDRRRQPCRDVGLLFSEDGVRSAHNDPDIRFLRPERP
jgi:hypothetical protein